VTPEDVFEELETERAFLRAVTPDDAPDLFRWASDPEVARYVSWEAHRSVEESAAFLRERLSRGDGPSWALVPKEGGGMVGFCRYVRWTPEHARAELAYVLSRDYWGGGLMTEAVGAMIRFGFWRMGLNRIEARCVAGNAASARVMEKAGMTYEGTLREREFTKGAFRDMKIYSILKREWGRG
jgi:ribosomal-protein-alanine N-acetyltransferase